MVNGLPYTRIVFQKLISNFGYYKGVQSVGILICSDEYLQVLGLTQPAVLTLEWIRGS